MESLGNFSEILKYIKDLGFGAALGAGLFGSIYLAFCLITSSIPDINYLYLILILGVLFGYGVQGILVLINKRSDKLKDFQIEKQILQEKLNLVQENVDCGRLNPNQASEITVKALREFVLLDRETESTNILESREQKQIPQSQEEEE